MLRWRALIRAIPLVLCDDHGQLDRSAAGAVPLLLDLHARQTMLVVVTHSIALAERFPRRYEMNEGPQVTSPDLRHPQPHVPLADQSGRAARSRCGIRAVLAGALVVGDSVRGSPREIALGRLGRTETVVSTATFVRADVADRLRESISHGIRRAARDRECLRYA